MAFSSTTVNEELHQVTKFLPYFFHRKNTDILPECICLNILDKRELLLDLRYRCFSFQQFSGQAELISQVVHCRQLVNIGKHHSVHEVIKTLCVFVRVVRGDKRSDMLLKLQYIHIGQRYPFFGLLEFLHIFCFESYRYKVIGQSAHSALTGICQLLSEILIGIIGETAVLQSKC